MLERCATRGRSWSYVLRALENEADGPQQSGTENASGWDQPGLPIKTQTDLRQQPPGELQFLRPGGYSFPGRALKRAAKR